jgi:NADP-reducing hydrogenase subunit HndC
VTLRPDQLDTPLDFAAVRALGGRLGSAALVVLGAGDCPVALVRQLVADGAAASCGTCPPCRIGLDVVLRLLHRIESGGAEASDLDRLDRLCSHIRRSALCEHGRHAARSVLASLRAFADLYEDHLSARGCPCSGETVGD